MFRIVKLIIFIFLVFPLTAPLYGETRLRIAVAANFIHPFNEIITEFEKKTGQKVEGVFASTGSLYNQIINGAPYDIFLSADEERPEKLFNDGLSNRPFVYARGTVVLWTGKESLCRMDSWQKVLRNQELVRVALANPVTAPYGTSALNALEKNKLHEMLKSRIITAQTVAQSFQYASTGSVDAAFCALSAALSEQGKRGCYYIIDDAPPVIQSASVLKRSKNPEAAGKFVEFLLSPEVEKIKSKYGYR